MNHKELITFDKVFQYYLNDNDCDEDARDLYLTTMEAHTIHLEVWNEPVPPCMK